MTSFTTKHYRIGHQPVVAVFGTDQNAAVQAWYPNSDTGRLERKDTYIQDIDASDCAQPISAQEFQNFCDKAGIENVLPERSIRRSLALAQFSANSAEALRTIAPQNPRTHFNFG